MANKKKTNIVPDEQNKKDEISVDNSVSTNQQPEAKPTSRRKAIQIDRNEMIPCRSVVNGQLTYISARTGLTYIWNDFGVTEYLEYGELLSMRASQPKFLTKPWIVVDDEEAVSTIAGLKELYGKIVDIGEDNLEDFFKKDPKKIEEIIGKVPKGIQDLIASKAREMLEKRTLYDTRIIGIIDKVMNTGLKDFIK
jgi:hypothetical protein